MLIFQILKLKVKYKRWKHAVFYGIFNNPLLGQLHKLELCGKFSEKIKNFFQSRPTKLPKASETPMGYTF